MISSKKSTFDSKRQYGIFIAEFNNSFLRLKRLNHWVGIPPCCRLQILFERSMHFFGKFPIYLEACISHCWLDCDCTSVWFYSGLRVVEMLQNPRVQNLHPWIFAPDGACLWRGFWKVSKDRKNWQNPSLQWLLSIRQVHDPSYPACPAAFSYNVRANSYPSRPSPLLGVPYAQQNRVFEKPLLGSPWHRE